MGENAKRNTNVVVEKAYCAVRRLYAIEESVLVEFSDWISEVCPS